jgi:hypothetical protein
MKIDIVNVDSLARALFYSVTNPSQYGNSARINDAKNTAINFGIDSFTQDAIGLTKALEKLNFPNK